MEHICTYQFTCTYYFQIRLASELLLLLDPYLTRFYVSIKMQDVCLTCCETSLENDVSNRYQNLLA